MTIRTATVYPLKVIERGRINPWMNYEIEKQKTVYDDGETKTSYAIFIEGDRDDEVKTIKEARQYIKDLRDSWLENHPGETI